MLWALIACAAPVVVYAPAGDELVASGEWCAELPSPDERVSNGGDVIIEAEPETSFRQIRRAVLRVAVAGAKSISLRVTGGQSFLLEAPAAGASKLEVADTVSAAELVLQLEEARSRGRVALLPEHAAARPLWHALVGRGRRAGTLAGDKRTAALKPTFAALSKCPDATNRHGRMPTRLLVSESGAAEVMQVGDAEVDACLAKAMRGLSLPAPDGGFFYFAVSRAQCGRR